MSAVEPLQQTLAAEHAAVYVLGVCAAQTSFTRERALWKRLDQAIGEHKRQRDELHQRVLELGAEPVAAAAAYAVPTVLNTTARIRRAAQGVEARCTDTYGALVASTEGGSRGWAISALAQGAVRELWFRGSPETFPGLS